MKIKHLEVGRDWEGNPTLTITLNKAENEAVDKLLQIDDENIGEYKLSIEKSKKKRSLDANAYLWVLLGKLAYKLKTTKEEVYKQYIINSSAYKIVPVAEQDIEDWKRIWEHNGLGWICEDLGKCKRIKGHHNILSYYGTSAYNTKEMSHLIDLVIFDCKEQGIETLPPDKLKRLKEMWK